MRRNNLRLSEGRFVKPLVLQEEALQVFNKTTKWRRKQEPEKIELIYFPYYLFRVSITEGTEDKELFLALDGIQEEFTFLEMKDIEFLKKTESPHFKFRIKINEAKEKVLDEYQWLLIKYRSFKKGRTKIKGIKETKEFYYPYWVGYYKERNELDCRKASYDFKAIDGISGKFIGLKMHRAFLKAFSDGLCD